MLDLTIFIGNLSEDDKEMIGYANHMEIDGSDVTLTFSLPCSTQFSVGGERLTAGAIVWHNRGESFDSLRPAVNYLSDYDAEWAQEIEGM